MSENRNNNEPSFMSRGQAEWGKMYGAQLITLLTLSLVLVALVVASVVSYLQTEIAFRPTNDATIQIFGFNIGLLLSNALAMIFQYGQNGALLYRVLVKNDKKLFVLDLFFTKIKITDRMLALWAFIVFALVDCGTNLYWLETVWESPDGVILWILRVVMVLSVFSEEVIGIVLELWTHTYKVVKGLRASSPVRNAFAQSRPNNDGGRRQNSFRPVTRPENVRNAPVPLNRSALMGRVTQKNPQDNQRERQPSYQHFPFHELGSETDFELDA